MLTENTEAPLDVQFVTEQGQPGTLREYLGRWVVVYFYPKDNTPGCTLEAEEFRDNQKEFEEHNAVIIGVSKDSCASHQKFIAKKNLPFTLVADTDHALMSAFGTWGERTFMGKRYMGTTRSTFLIRPDGVIARVWGSVKLAGHPREVLATIQELQESRG